MPSEAAERIKADEKAYFQSLQQSGKWRHIWRVAGQYSNISIFDVESNEELHQLFDVAAALSLHAHRSDGALPPPFIAACGRPLNLSPTLSDGLNTRSGM